ncbi:MAG: GDSL-type esterase/lipase family protein, partial [Pirellulaceae bacterium]
MLRLIAILLTCLSTIDTASAQSEPQDFHDSSRWKAEIAAFEQADQDQIPPENSILFVGSSSIRLWDLKRSFPSMVAINRGFGGSQLADSVQFIDRIVLKYKPLACVLYAGDNDLAAGKSPERVFADFAEFGAILQRHLPGTTLHYISIKPSPSRWKMVDRVRRTNELIRTYCELNDTLFFVDIEA